MTTQEKYSEALNRAQNCRSDYNISLVINHFSDLGIDEENILPGENVLTFAAWKALNRYVKKGEHGCKVITYITGKKKDKKGNEESYTYPKTTAVFHISQTEKLK